MEIKLKVFRLVKDENDVIETVAEFYSPKQLANTEYDWLNINRESVCIYTNLQDSFGKWIYTNDYLEVRRVIEQEEVVAIEWRVELIDWEFKVWWHSLAKELEREWNLVEVMYS